MVVTDVIQTIILTAASILIAGIAYAQVNPEALAAAAPTDPDDTPTQIAILVSEEVGLGVSRIYQTLRESRGGRRKLRIYRDLPSLRAWMGLPEDWTPRGR